MKRLLWAGCLSYMLIGLAHVVVGALLPELLQYYGRDYRDGGQIIFAQFAGFLIGVLTTPWWSGRIGRRKTILLALIMLLAAESVYSLLPPWQWMLTAAPLAGWGFGMIEAAIGALIIDAFHEKTAVAMSKLEVFFGVGALLMPVAASLMISLNVWSLSFLWIIALTLCLIVAWGFLSYGEADPQLDGKASSTAARTSAQPPYAKDIFPLLGLFIVIFLLYVGLEMSLVNFMPSLLIENSGVSSAMGTLSVTFYWVAMVIGRVYAGVLAEKISYSRYLIWHAAGTLLVLIAFAAVTNVWIVFALIVLLGLLMSGMFSIALVFANALLPGMTERVTSLLIASGGIGGALFPLLTGWCMDHWSTGVTPWIFAVITLLLLSLIVLASRAESPRAAEASR